MQLIPIVQVKFEEAADKAVAQSLKEEKEEKNIIVEVEGGLVSDIKNLPEGWTYEIHDNDIKGICSLCKETVVRWQWRDHLKSHNPNAEKMEPEEVGEFFSDVV